MNSIFILNGPNLNLLGEREPALYGHGTLGDLQALCETRGQALGLHILFRQSNEEGELIAWIHEARTKASGIIINAAAFTHTSIALLDALLAVEIPIIEVHLSNIFRREEFRRHSYISLAAKGVICGLGRNGYELAIEAMATLVKPDSKS